MRILLTICLALALAACGSKKKAPQSPANSANESAPAGGAADSTEEKDINSPDAGEAGSPKADPCEGGE